MLMNFLFMNRYGKAFREAHGSMYSVKRQQGAENTFDAVQRRELSRCLNTFYI